MLLIDQTIDNQLQTIQGQIRALPIRALIKNRLLENINTAISCFADGQDSMRHQQFIRNPRHDSKSAKYFSMLDVLL
jgi:hypothetical protein